jgi:hypothetical protein
LKQNDANQGHRDQKMNNDKDGLHEISLFLACFRRFPPTAPCVTQASIDESHLGEKAIRDIRICGQDFKAKA